MALALTHLTSAGDDANATSYTTASVSPAANSLVVIGIVGAVSATPPTPTVTGFTVTFTAVQSSAFDTAGTQRTLFTFYGQMGASPGSGTIGISFGATTMSGCTWSVVQVTGHNTTTPTRFPVESHSTGTSQSATLGALGDTADVALAFVGSDESVTFTGANGFTILGQATSPGGAPVQAIGSLWKLNATNPATTSTGTAGQQWGMAAVELVVAGTYTPPMGLSYRVAFAFGIAPGTVPTAGQWTYFDGRVKSVEITRGRNRETEDIQPSRCRLKLDDPSRNLEPDFSGSTYSPNVVPMTPVKVEAWYRTGAGSTMYPRFIGYVDDFQPLWNRALEVVVPCSDAAALLQATALRHPYVQAVLNTTPNVYWRLSETDATQLAVDRSGNNVSGSYGGTPMFSQPDPITDNIDGAILFPIAGAGAWMGAPAGDLSVAAMTMAVWFRHATVTWTDLSYLIAWTNTDGYGQQVALRGTSLASPGTISVFTGGGGYTTAARYDDDAWHFLVVTLDGTNGHLYIDGTDVSGAFSSLGPYIAGQITVGGWPLSGANFSFGGYVDEPAFWLRAITAAEVTAMWSARNAWLGQATGARVAAVLSAASWGWGQVLDTGLVTLQSAGDLEGTAAWAHILQVTGRSGEGGLFYVDTQGRAILHDGQWPLRNATVQGTYGDTSGELRFESVEPESSNATIRNEWRGQRSGGPLQVASDATSVTRYLRRSEPQGGGAIGFVIQSDAQVLSLLQWNLAHYKDPLFTVRRMVVRQASDAMVQTSLGLDLQQRITVNRRPNGGTLHGSDHLVQGYTERWGHEEAARWSMTFTLSPAEAQVYGGWGVGLWGSTFRWVY